MNCVHCGTSFLWVFLFKCRNEACFPIIHFTNEQTRLPLRPNLSGKCSSSHFWYYSLSTSLGFQNRKVFWPFLGHSTWHHDSSIKCDIYNTWHGPQTGQISWQAKDVDHRWSGVKCCCPGPQMHFLYLWIGKVNDN